MAHALIFDSGVGGLSVAADMRRLLPELYLSYAADDIFRPYGNKTEAELKDRLPGLLRSFEIMLSPDVIVVACNTASTTALPEIRAAVTCPVIGVVPAIKPAAKQTRTGTMAVLGTPGTIRREYVDDLIRDFAADRKVILHGSTRLVELAEAKLAGETITAGDVRAELDSLLTRPGADRVDQVVLACTHFPLLRAELAAAALDHIEWIDSGEAIARRAKTVLADTHTNTPTHPQTAFLVGPRPGDARLRAFQSFGFEKVVPLLP